MLLCVNVEPAGRHVTVPRGATLLDALRSVADVDSPCGGVGKCGKCSCEIEEQPTPSSRHTVLACQHKVLTNITAYVHTPTSIITTTTTTTTTTTISSKDLVLCVDVGSTTLAAALIALPTERGHTQAILSAAATPSQPLLTFALQNPQTKYGADVMTRIGYCRDHGDSAVTALRTCLMDALTGPSSPLYHSLPRVRRVVATGNPTMLHILLGVSPAPLGVSPFRPTITDAVSARAGDIGLERWLGADTEVRTFPVVGGHVGGDLVACALVAGLGAVPPNSGEVWALLDIGTNCEVAVATAGRILACSCPTGPALEGAEISCGMRAVAGAINTVRVGPAPSFSTAWTTVDNSEQAAGICGSGLIDAIAELVSSGALTPSGAWSDALKASASSQPRFVMKTKRTGEFVLVDEAHSQTGRPITITSKDVRAVQLAKAALHAGVSVLLERLGAKTPSRLFIAGAFGCNIDVARAMQIGMLPQCPLGSVRLLGNAALSGAVACAAGVGPAADLAGRIEHVELAQDAGFQDKFVSAMRLGN